MKTIRQVTELTGVTPRTLHYYDAIGLLKPTAVSEAGYRSYDDAALERLQDILLFRELEFPLKEIKRILDHPEFDRQEALEQQIRLLELRREHLERLIRLAKRSKKGENTVDMKAFDRRELERYAQEVKERWGGTAAYAESKEKMKGKTGEEMDAMGEAMMDIFTRLGAEKDGSPDSPETQALVKELQDFITEHYYHCTGEILAGLGQMYAADERMRKNIDRAGGEGTAVFAAEAIRAYTAGT